jgi:hypothetical protein
MATEIMDRINQLNAERAELFRQAGAGRSGDRTIMTRVHDIDSELQELWEERRRERIGRLEGIDLVVEQEYERVYGPDYRPMPVVETAEERRNSRKIAA